MLPALNQSRWSYCAGIQNGEDSNATYSKNIFLFILCNFAAQSVVFAVKFDSKLDNAE
jgi:hypothetical protein